MMDYVKNDGLDFVSDVEIELWLSAPKPEANMVEAFVLDCLTVQQAAKHIGRCDGYVRKLIHDGEVEVMQGAVRKYVKIALSRLAEN